MKRSRYIPGLSAGLLGLALFIANGRSADPVTQAPAAKDAKPAVANDAKFHAKLLEIAKEYESYGRVDAGRRWAPTDCAAPRMNPDDPTISRVRHSAAAGDDAHAGKLYSLFAKDRAAYRSTAGKPAAAGQVIVKESWTPKEITEAEGKTQVELRSAGLGLMAGYGEEVVTAARKGGKLYKADKKGDLFIMVKLDPAADGTDAGWVYGTVTPDGKTVTSSGKVESCMGCHVKAPHDRLFGLPKN